MMLNKMLASKRPCAATPKYLIKRPPIIMSVSKDTTTKEVDKTCLTR